MMLLAFILFGGLTYLCFKAYFNLKKYKDADSPEVKKRKKNAVIFGCIGLFGTWVCLGDIKQDLIHYTHSSSRNTEYHSTAPAASPAKVQRTNQVSNDKTYASDGLKCTQCFGHYQGGFCTQCGAASADRVQESYSKAANCEFCGGSGVVPYGNRYKVCSSCRGSGKQIY